jgi:tetratricopeptide (TPR) repeat protein
VNILACRVMVAVAGMAVLGMAATLAGATAMSGTVRDAVTHQAIVRAVVMVELRDSGYAGQTETDGSGRFRLQDIGGGQFLVRVRFPGYDEADQEADLSTFRSAYLNFELWPKPSTAPRAVAPEGPGVYINARLASVPNKARKEFTKARELWQGGKDPQDCIDHLKKAVKNYPQFSDAYVLMASAYMQQGNAADAKATLDHAIEADPKLPEAWFMLGILQNRQKDFAGAEKSLTEGLKLDDAAPRGHYELGKTYLALNRPDDADQQAKKAIALLPTMAPAHILLGNIAWKKQDAATALQEYQEYLKLDPKGPMAPGAQAMVKRIQDWFSQPQNSQQ